MRSWKELGVKKIGVFRALQLGDMLCAIPAVRSLKQAVPDSEIILIGLPWAKSFVQRYKKYFSGFISFPGYPGLPEQNWSTSMFSKFLKEVADEKFDLIIQMQGNGTIVNSMVELLGAKYTAGFFSENNYRPNSEFFIEYPEGKQEVHRHLDLMKCLGCESLSDELEFPVSREEWSQFYRLMEKHHLKAGSYVVLHAGGRDERKWWSAKNFAAVGEYLFDKGYQVVLTGTEIEKHMVEAVQSEMNRPAINLVGQTNLGLLALLLKNSKLLFSNDTGVSHVAAAIKARSVVVFLYSDPVRWAPLNRSLHQVILPEDSENLDLIKASIDLKLMDEDQSNKEMNVEHKLEREKGYEDR